jgi:prepilin signal peptidase PulO-like enzyme (type II secretory pathway)
VYGEVYRNDWGAVFNGVGQPHIEMGLNFISIFFLAAVIYLCSFYVQWVLSKVKLQRGMVKARGRVNEA